MNAPRRLDSLLVLRGFFASRTRAKAAIEAGLVRVAGKNVRAPSAAFAVDADIAVDGDVHDYVSRGGLKLAAALDAFAIDPADKVCLDLGASTGGFTQVLLRRGAARVYAVDVGAGQLHSSLHADPRVISHEKTHARTLTRALIPDPIEILVCDVSFISLKIALPPALTLCAPGARLVALVKPQFELGRSFVGKGGVVRARDDDIAGLIRSLSAMLEERGWSPIGDMLSPVKGGDGNEEHLIGAARR